MNDVFDIFDELLDEAVPTPRYEDIDILDVAEIASDPDAVAAILASVGRQES